MPGWSWSRRCLSLHLRFFAPHSWMSIHKKCVVCQLTSTQLGGNLLVLSKSPASQRVPNRSQYFSTRFAFNISTVRFGQVEITGEQVRWYLMMLITLYIMVCCSVGCLKEVPYPHTQVQQIHLELCLFHQSNAESYIPDKWILQASAFPKTNEFHQRILSGGACRTTHIVPKTCLWNFCPEAPGIGRNMQRHLVLLVAEQRIGCLILEKYHKCG